MKPVFRLFPYFLLSYHLLFAYVAWQYVLENNGDATRYWFVGEDLDNRRWDEFLNPGTPFIKLLTFPLVKYLDMPFGSGFMLFSLIGFFGYLFLWRRMAQSNIFAGPWWVTGILIAVLLLPNSHFWTSLIGKEPVFFVAAVLYFREQMEDRPRSVLLWASWVVLALIRPHVAFVFLLSDVLSRLVTGGLTLRAKAVLLSAFAVLSLVLIWLLTRLQDFTGGFQRVLRKYEAHILHFRKTDAYVPLDEYPLPYKLFTFYFRPLPGEKAGLYYHIISIENTALLFLFLVLVYHIVRNFNILKKSRNFIFLLTVLLSFGLMYVYAYANYGILMRTRIMVFPALFLLIITVLHKRRREHSLGEDCS